MDLTLVTKPQPESDSLATDGLVRKHLTRKLAKIEERLGGKPIACRAVLEELPVGFQATITMSGRRETGGKAKEKELLKAVDSALDKIGRQVDARLKKNTGKERARRASGERRQIKGDGTF